MRTMKGGEPMNLQDKKTFLEEFGNRVKQTRIEKGMTLEELANKIGYTTENARSSAQKIEAGRSDPPASKIRILAKVLDVSVGYLMGWDEMDNTHDTKKLQLELKQIELEAEIEKQYGTSTKNAISLYVQLDTEDQAEIRGEMKQMLKSEKYSIQKESSVG